MVRLQVLDSRNAPGTAGSRCQRAGGGNGLAEPGEKTRARIGPRSTGAPGNQALSSRELIPYIPGNPTLHLASLVEPSPPLGRDRTPERSGPLAAQRGWRSTEGARGPPQSLRRAGRAGSTAGGHLGPCPLLCCTLGLSSRFRSLWPRWNPVVTASSAPPATRPSLPWRTVPFERAGTALWTAVPGDRSSDITNCTLLSSFPVQPRFARAKDVVIPQLPPKNKINKQKS